MRNECTCNASRPGSNEARVPTTGCGTQSFREESMGKLGIPHAIGKAPAIVRSSTLQHSIKVELSTPAIGAELTNISIADVARDDALASEIRKLWLQHKVLF